MILSDLEAQLRTSAIRDVLVEVSESESAFAAPLEAMTKRLGDGRVEADDVVAVLGLIEGRMRALQRLRALTNPDQAEAIQRGVVALVHAVGLAVTHCPAYRDLSRHWTSVLRKIANYICAVARAHISPAVLFRIQVFL